MSMDAPSDPRPPVRFYAFGPFVADSVKRLLLREGAAVPLTSKAFDILLTLIAHRDRIVEKDDFMREVWQGAIVEDNNLVRNISTLRKALDEGRDDHRYIVTVPGRGYRFVADVEAGSAVPIVPVAKDESPVAPPLVTTLAPAERVMSRWLYGAIAGAATLVAGLGLALMWVQFPKAPAPSNHPSKIWQLTFDSGLQGEPSWSPDGRMVAYSSDRAGNLDIWVQSVPDGVPFRLTTSAEHDWQPDWSPDGRSVVFRSERNGGGLFVVPASGGAEQQIANFGFHPRWSPDGTRVFFHRSNFQGLNLGAREVFVVNLDGTPARNVRSDVVREFSSFQTAWHPDGRRISIWGTHRTEGLSFWTVPLDEGAPVRSEISEGVQTRLKESAVSFSNPDRIPVAFRWSPSGDALFFEGRSEGVLNLWKINVDPKTLEWREGPERLTTGAELNAELTLTADGRRLAFVSRTEHIRLWSFPFDANAGRLTGPGTPITADGMNALSPDISPDGKQLVYCVERGGRQELWAKSLEDGRETRLVAGDRFRRANPRWSYDSHDVAYTRRENGRSGNAADYSSAIVVASSTGGGEQIFPAVGSMPDMLLDWSTDGAWILGASRHSNRGAYALALFPINPDHDRVARTLASDPHRDLWQARFSPNQKWVSFAAAQPGASAIYSMPARGGTQVAITDGRFFDDRPRWAPDSRTIYFLSNRTGFFNLWGRRFDPDAGVALGEPFEVTRFVGPARTIPPRMIQLGVAITANELVLPISDVSSNIWVLEGLGR
jgi:Tol biopolymer transport system component/DNA-binding winged helix-turn-helix (wHTH) protein